MIKLETSCHVKNFDIENRKISQPVEAEIKVMDIHSLFAGKLNALLTRRKKNEKTGILEDYNEGRDWYDLLWYIEKGIEPKFDFLSSKLNEMGPFENKNLITNTDLVKEKLLEREKTLDYKEMNESIKMILRKPFSFDKESLVNTIKDFGKNGFVVKYIKKN